MGRTRRRFGPGSNPGFTLVELLVVIGIIAALISILMPALARARNQAMRVNCQSQLRQLCNATMMYANNYKGWLPGPSSIYDVMKFSGASASVDSGLLWQANLITDKRVWICPVDHRRQADLQYSYTYNCRMIVKRGFEDVFTPSNPGNPEVIPPPHFRRITTFKSPSDCILFAEENITNNNPQGWQINDAYFVYYDTTDNRHMGKSEVGYLDGHAGDIPPKIQIYTSKEWGWCH